MPHTENRDDTNQPPNGARKVIGGAREMVGRAQAAIDDTKELIEETTKTLREADRTLEDFLGLFGCDRADVRRALEELQTDDLKSLPANEGKIKQELKEFKSHFKTSTLWGNNPNYLRFKRALKSKETSLTFNTFYTNLEPIIKTIHNEAEEEIKSCYTAAWNLLASFVKKSTRFVTNTQNPGSLFEPVLGKMEKFCLAAGTAVDNVRTNIESCTDDEKIAAMKADIQKLEQLLKNLLRPLQQTILRYAEDKQRQVVDALGRLLKDSKLDIDTNKLKSDGFIEKMPKVLVMFRILSSLAGVPSKHENRKHGDFGYGALAKVCQDCIAALKNQVESRKLKLLHGPQDAKNRHMHTPDGFSGEGVTKSSIN